MMFSEGREIMIAVILAGGNSKRFGRDKLLADICGKPMLYHTIQRLMAARNISHIVLVTSKGKVAVYRELWGNIVSEDYGIGPIGGIYVALKKYGDIFVVGGDMPLINPNLVDMMIERFSEGDYSICIGHWGKELFEPLHAVYSANLITPIAKNISSGEYSLHKLIHRVSNRCLINIRELTPREAQSFFNVNTPRDYEYIRNSLLCVHGK